VAIVPPLAPLPLISFGDNDDALDPAARRAVLLSAWAATRWNSRQLGVPGLPLATTERPTLPQRRALAIATVLKEQDIAATPAPASGQRFRLVGGMQAGR